MGIGSAAVWMGYKACVRACVVCKSESIDFFVRELVEEKRINVPFVNSVDSPPLPSNVVSARSGGSNYVYAICKGGAR